MENHLIYIRSIEENDIETIRSWNYDTEISNFFPSRWPISLNEQKKWFENQINNQSKKKLMIIDKSSNEAIGMIGLMQIDYINKNCEIGLTLGNKNYWGKGFGKIAMDLITNAIFNDFNFHLIYLTVMEENSRAIKFFEKCGFTTSGKLEDIHYKNGAYKTYLWMRLKKEEYLLSK